MSDQLDAKPLPKHRTQTQNKRHRHPCLQWDSNPRSQRPSERRQSSCLRPRGYRDRGVYEFHGLLTNHLTAEREVMNSDELTNLLHGKRSSVRYLLVI
jgi:hypothetical protein